MCQHCRIVFAIQMTNPTFLFTQMSIKCSSSNGHTNTKCISHLHVFVSMEKLCYGFLLYETFVSFNRQVRAHCFHVLIILHTNMLLIRLEFCKKNNFQLTIRIKYEVCSKNNWICYMLLFNFNCKLVKSNLVTVQWFDDLEGNCYSYESRVWNSRL